MKRFFYAAVAVLFALPVMAAQHTNGNYVVVLNGNEAPDVIARQHGIGRQKTWTHALHGFSATLNGNQADRLEQDTRVAVIEPDLEVHTLAQTVPTGVRRIGCLSNALWQASSVTPINCDIAILDTGIDLTHPDLNVYQQVSFTTNSTANDGHGHGTHCAGIAAAKNNTGGVVGVAPGARLWAVKVLNDSGSGYLSSIISGVDYVTQHASEIDVASMSLGGDGYSSSLRIAIQNSVAAGVVYVVAAGNATYDLYGSDKVLGTDDDQFPGCYPEVMTVSAMGDSDGLAGGLGAATSYGDDDTMAYFSNYSTAVDSSNPVHSPGLAIDVAAPGVEIYSTYKNGGYATLSGTSMACPHVAGAVALYIAAHSKPTTAAGVYAIRQALIDSAIAPTSWGKNVWNPFPYFDFYPEPLVWVGGSLGSTPTVKITAPSAFSSFAFGATTTFTGTATDTEDGSLSASIAWRVNGTSAGTGASVSYTFSTAGTKTITATVTDSAGNVASDQISVTVNAAATTPPTVTIAAPTAGSTVSNPVSFSGSATDSTDGTITGKLTWRSDIDGPVGTGGLFTSTLTPGAHTVTASVTNSLAVVGSATRSFTVSGSAPPTTNHPPIVTINYPVAGSSFADGSQVTVSSTANDIEDGDLTSSIQINDNYNGNVGTGGTVLYFPCVGNHVLTASVKDSTNAVATTTRSFTVYARQTNAPPSLYITLPPDNWTVVSNTAVALHATATDAEDGTLVPAWYNSMSGLLGSGANLTNTFVTVGTNIVTATVTDAGGLVASSTVNVIVTNAAPNPNAYPVVTLTAPTNGLTVTVGATVGYAATAVDYAASPLVPDWYDSIDGTLGSGTSGTYTPTVGTHRLTASATDADGQVGSQTVLVQVNNTNALPTELVVTVTCNKSAYTNKEKARITATVRTLSGTAVSGATCLFNVRGANGSTQTKTFTTVSGGTAQWPLQINKSRMGTGNATVTCTASKTGYYNGTSAPVSFTVY